jgi:peptidoglycan/LPS O-acetylase OafA/YrhL
LVDQLRCIAIFLVLLHHLFSWNLWPTLPWVNGFRDFSKYGSQSVLAHLFYLGWAGVPLFFVLSGFCIHWSCLRWERFDAGRFYWQRFWRLYPAYLAALIPFTWLAMRGQCDVSPQQIWSHVFLVHNFSQKTFFGINGPFWSIAVEVQLYLLYPLLLAIKQRAGWRGCFLAAGSLGLVWRIIAVAAWGMPVHGVDAAMASPLNTWLDWMLGARIAESYRAGQRVFSSNKGVPSATLACFVLSTLWQPLTVFAFFFASLTAAICFDQLLHRRSQPRASAGITTVIRKGAAWFGLISYSFYLWHQPILVCWLNLSRHVFSTHLPPALYLALNLAAPIIPATLVAYLSYRFLEKPGIQLGRWLLGHLAMLTRPDSKTGELAPSRSEVGVR